MDMDKFYDVNQTVIDYVFGNPDLRDLILKQRKLLMLQYLKKKICNVIRTDMYYRTMRAMGMYGWAEQSMKVFNSNPNREITWTRENESEPTIDVMLWSDEAGDWVAHESLNQ